jgi:hypothetical protein
MQNLDKIVQLVPLSIVIYFACSYFRNGSLVGALLGGRITATLGRVDVGSSWIGPQSVCVHRVDPGCETASFVAVEVMSKSILGDTLVPVKLSPAEARRLAALLNDAADARPGLATERR